MLRIRGGKLRLFGVALLSFLLLAASAIAAEEITRQQYKEGVEPICKTNVLANKRIFKGAKGEVKQGKLKKASGHFFRAADAFLKTIEQLEVVPRPVADEAKLQKWFSALRTEKSIIEKIGRALKAEKKRKAETLSVELERNSRTANNTVLAFGFNYCRIDPARFS